MQLVVMRRPGRRQEQARVRELRETVAFLALFDSPALPSTERPEEYGDAKLLPVFARFLGARRSDGLGISLY